MSINQTPCEQCEENKATEATFCSRCGNKLVTYNTDERKFYTKQDNGVFGFTSGRYELGFLMDHGQMKMRGIFEADDKGITVSLHDRKTNEYPITETYVSHKAIGQMLMHMTSRETYDWSTPSVIKNIIRDDN